MDAKLQENYKKAAESLYEKSKPYLRKKNGLFHVMYFYISGKADHKMFCCDPILTDQVNQILLCMQKDDYEIIDVELRPTLEDSDFHLGSLTQKMFLLSIKYR
jgi:hypothetical protein